MQLTLFPLLRCSGCSSTRSASRRGARPIQISRRYCIHTQVHSLTKHVYARRAADRNSLVKRQTLLIEAITDDADNPALLEELLLIDKKMAELVVTAEEKQV